MLLRADCTTEPLHHVARSYPRGLSALILSPRQVLIADNFRSAARMRLPLRNGMSIIRLYAGELMHC
jgi:hypothetical protein